MARTTDIEHIEQKATNFRELVGKALHADRFTLEDFPVLSELPIVEQWAATHPHQMLARARALEALLHAAVHDVLRALDDAPDRTSRRIVRFIQLRYQEHTTVTAIAREFGIDRASVHRLVAPQALELVTRRFLQLAEGSALQAAARQCTAGERHAKAS